MTNDDEKANAYDMALEAARKELGVGRKEWEVVQRVLHNIFPELRESEDERNIDTIFNCLYQCCDTGFISGAQRDNALAWLEKQKDFAANEYWRGFGAGRDEVIANPDAFNLQEKQKEQKEQKPINSFDIVPYIDDKIAALQDMWREEKVSFDWDDLIDMIEDVARHFFSLGLNARKEE